MIATNVVGIKRALEVEEEKPDEKTEVEPEEKKDEESCSEQGGTADKMQMLAEYELKEKMRAEDENSSEDESSLEDDKEEEKKEEKKEETEQERLDWLAEILGSEDVH